MAPLQVAIRRAVDGADLAEEEAREVAGAILDGQATPAQIAGLLVALRVKRESAAEIVGFARAMRERAETVRAAHDLVDTCGTGGDGKGTFNVSTIAALVAAGAGCRVAKHGNRAVSGCAGSADLLEALGVPIETTPDRAARLIALVGVAFLFAPRYHRGAGHAAGCRREIGVRSMFHIVGPLVNPAGARRQVVGVFEPGLLEPVGLALAALGTVHALVVHGRDGLDEITLTTATDAVEVRGGRLRSLTIDPEALGFSPCAEDDLAGGDTETNARIAREVLGGRKGPARDVVLLNAGAAIHVAGRACTIEGGIALARESIDRGLAAAKLRALVAAGETRDV